MMNKLEVAAVYTLFGIILFLFPHVSYSYDVKVLESNERYIKLAIDFSGDYTVRDSVYNGRLLQYIQSGDPIIRESGVPALPEKILKLGIMQGSSISIEILSDEKEILPNRFILPCSEQPSEMTPSAGMGRQGKIGSTNDDGIIFRQDIYSSDRYYPENTVSSGNSFSFRYSFIQPVIINPYQFNPVTRQLVFHRRLQLKIVYSGSKGMQSGIAANPSVHNDFLTNSFLDYGVLNPEQAKNWLTVPDQNLTFTPVRKLQDTFWYNPSYEYFRLFVHKKGLYRVTYEQLQSAGFFSRLLSSQIKSSGLHLYGNELPVAVDVVDKGDGTFDPGDYIQFVGTEPPASPYCTLNIYTLSNIYWLSYQPDRPNKPYISIDGRPDATKPWVTTLQTHLETLHYERDSLFERLGYAKDGKRDYWFWGRASGQNGMVSDAFSVPFSSPEGLVADSVNIRLRVNLHGMTANDFVFPDHNAEIMLTSQYVSRIRWDGQSAVTFDTTFSIKNIGLFADNNMQVRTLGDLPSNPDDYKTDEIRVNWFEIDYWKENRVNGNYYNFVSPPGYTGNIRFNVFRWKSSNITVYIPDRGEKITNADVTNSEYEEVLFTDNIAKRTEYFCAADDYYLVPDSISKAAETNLHSAGNAADYLIITHPDFMTSANRLAEFRSKNLEGFASPRIKVVDVNRIYDEFSGGLLDPLALKKFIAHTFNNWQKPAPAYVVLLGDMSWDYRHIMSASRPNFVPSILFHTTNNKYGLAVSDNDLVAVTGDDNIPDMAIGRLSCETEQEASVLIDKIISYPADASKQWKENVLLISAGESPNDERRFHFNMESTWLSDNFVKKSGYNTSMVVSYPGSDTLLQKYQGGNLEIRNEINKGTAIVNFYGHGGGYQWDNVFLTDDIFELKNESRLPFVTSVTCYTAHFDNQEVFGEQFLKTSGKGAIGFWGSTGLTSWNFGLYLNKILFDNIFNKKSFVLGNAILNTKLDFISQMGPLATRDAGVVDHIAIFSYLGDPAVNLAFPQKADFLVDKSNITITPAYPVLGDTIRVQVKLLNQGPVFYPDSVLVRLSCESGGVKSVLSENRIPSFGIDKSIEFLWVSDKSGVLKFIVSANEDGRITEDDHSDNSAEKSMTVFNTKEPSVIRPFDAFVAPGNKVEFVLGDMGAYINRSLTYYIDIDTADTFVSPVVSGAFTSADGIARWTTAPLKPGTYFWRTRLYDGQLYSNWTNTRTFRIEDRTIPGSFYSGRQLNLFGKENFVYSDSTGAMELRTEVLPPHPDTSRFIEDLKFDLPSDLTGLSAIATDGSFVYIAHMAYYGGESLIHMIGTGNNGTMKGMDYGTVAAIKVKVWDQMFYYNGYLYIPQGDAHRLFRVNPENYDTSTVYIKDGMLNGNDASVHDGAFYLASDGRYVYNLAFYRKNPPEGWKYTLRKFDPENDWNVAGEDMILSGNSYSGLSGFFVTPDYLYVYEPNISGFLRRISLATGLYEEEWLSFIPYQGYRAWCYDPVYNNVYASVDRGGFAPKISKFAGYYKQSSGTLISPVIGPAVKWNKLAYNAEHPAGNLNCQLYGLNSATGKWDTLKTGVPPEYTLGDLDARKYSNLKVRFHFADSTFGSAVPMRLNAMNLDYTPPAEVSILTQSVRITPDSLLQGFPLTVKTGFSNIGFSTADSVLFSMYLNNSDTAFYSKTYSVKPDSVQNVEVTFSTAPLMFKNKLRISLSGARNEYYDFNNHIERQFYVSRDKEKPKLTVTSDGSEIVTGDIISAKPEIVFQMTDNSPLPLSDTSYFYILHNGNELSYKNDSVSFSYSNYPDSKAEAVWHPFLQNGKHRLDVLARDASGNYSDSAVYTVSFYVNNKNDISKVFNYPNPCSGETHFTFELTGEDLPEECTIKIFTVAGRKVREVSITPAALRFGFNKIFYDCRDQDGNSLANGVYFYKIIIKNKNITKSVTQKLAIVR